MDEHGREYVPPKYIKEFFISLGEHDAAAAFRDIDRSVAKKECDEKKAALKEEQRKRLEAPTKASRQIDKAAREASRNATLPRFFLTRSKSAEEERVRLQKEADRIAAKKNKAKRKEKKPASPPGKWGR